MTSHEIIKSVSKLSDSSLDKFNEYGTEVFSYAEAEEMIDLAIADSLKVLKSIDFDLTHHHRLSEDTLKMIKNIINPDVLITPLYHRSIIDLERYFPNLITIVGNDKGVELNKLINIDLLEVENEKIIILIPSYVKAINASFLESFLYNVIAKLGADKFNEKFSFETTGSCNVNNDLSEAIDRILRQEKQIK